MRTSQFTSALITALIKARGQFGKFVKADTAKVESAKGGYSYRYGDLAALFDATIPALLKEGLMLMQAPDVDEQGFCLVSRLSHTSGEFLECRFPLKVYDRAQEQGSAITYARRYSAQALLGVAAEEDDDGATAHAADVPPKPLGTVWGLVAKVADVTAGTTHGGTPRWTVRLSTGDTATTISQKLGAACSAVVGNETEYAVELKQTQWGIDIKSLKPLPTPTLPAVAPASEEPF